MQSIYTKENRVKDTNYNYGQPSLGRTKRMCEDLNKNQNSVCVEELIAKFYNELITKKITVDQTLKSIDEHIKNNGLTSRQLVDQNAINNNIQLYKETIGILKNYYELQSETLFDKNKQNYFALNYILSNISTQLKDFDGAIRYANNAKIGLSDSSSPSTFIEHYNVKLSLKITKLELLKAARPKMDQKVWTPKTILEHKTFGGETKILQKMYLQIMSTPFSALVLEMAALTAMQQDKFGIFFSSKFRDVNGCEGYYFLGNKIYLGYNMNTIKPEYVLHELTHWAMDQLFENACRPYGKDNDIQKKEYRECIRQVILKVLEHLYTKESLNTIKAKALCNIPIKDGFLSSKDYLACPHDWSDSLSLEELIENCCSNNDSFFTMGGLLHKTFISEVLCAKTTEEVSEELFYLDLAIKALRIWARYPKSDYDAEFITHMIQSLAVCPNYENSPCFQPVKDYLEKHVIPEMKKFKEGHPSKPRLEPDAIDSTLMNEYPKFKVPNPYLLLANSILSNSIFSGLLLCLLFLVIAVEIHMIFI